MDHQAPKLPLVMSPREAAAAVGRIPARRYGRQWRIVAEDLFAGWPR
jgi:hypothetical protein